MKKALSAKRMFTLGLSCLTAIGIVVGEAQARNACDLVTKSDVDTVLGVPTQAPSNVAHAPDTCEFPQVGYQQNNPQNNKVVSVYTTDSAADAYSQRMSSTLDGHSAWLPKNSKRALREVLDVADGAIWGWDGYYNSGDLAAFKNGTTTVVVVVGGLTEDTALAGAKKLVSKALGGSGKSGYVYAGAPAQRQIALSVLPISDSALGTGTKIPSETREQIAQLREKGLRVIQCVYNPTTHPVTYDYWYRLSPDNLGQLLAAVPSNPLSKLGGSGVRTCPETLALAQGLNKDQAAEADERSGPCGQLLDGRQWTNDEVLEILKARCLVVLSPKGQSYVAGLSEYLRTECHLPADPVSRTEIGKFLIPAEIVAGYGSQMSKPGLQGVLKNQFENTLAYKAGYDYITDRAKQTCRGELALALPEDIVHYLRNTVYVNGGKPRFVPGCVAHYKDSYRYSEMQCQCLADIGRAVIPNIYQQDFSPNLIGNITEGNGFVGAQLLACGLKNY